MWRRLTRMAGRVIGSERARESLIRFWRAISPGAREALMSSVAERLAALNARDRAVALAAAGAAAATVIVVAALLGVDMSEEEALRKLAEFGINPDDVRELSDEQVEQLVRAIAAENNVDEDIVEEVLRVVREMDEEDLAGAGSSVQMYTTPPQPRSGGTMPQPTVNLAEASSTIRAIDTAIMDAAAAIRSRGEPIADVLKLVEALRYLMLFDTATLQNAAVTMTLNDQPRVRMGQ